jgi:4-oxalocrotonate tautomerase
VVEVEVGQVNVDATSAVKRSRSASSQRAPVPTSRAHPQGRTIEQKQRLAEELTDVVVAILDWDRATVRVLFSDYARHDWAVGGLLASDRALGASDPLVVVGEVVKALNDHDLERFVAGYAPAATIERDGAQVAAGQADIRDRYGAIFAAFPSVHVEAHGRRVLGRLVVHEETVTGRSDQSERQIAIYEVVDRTITRERLLGTGT